MERVSFNSLKFQEFFDSLNPQNSGILFSTLLHLIILLFAVGLPNFFGSKDIYTPNIIPIEILNISEKTNIIKNETNKNISKKTATKQKKFNSSENTEVQKEFDLKENIKTINDDQPTIEIKEKTTVKIEEKKTIELVQKNKIENKPINESLKTKKIKPKIKPKFKKEIASILNSDTQIEPKIKKENNNTNKKVSTKPKTKPKEDFSIASMLKDLRNEKSNNVVEDVVNQEEEKQIGESEQNESMILSISEIDALRQQLSSCWNAPAGAVINLGDKVTISAKVQQNMKVFENSVRIIDTNISKSNPFYGPITDSAMRTLLNPECIPLKLPEDKYNLWKNLTITFDYSIMKGY